MVNNTFEGGKRKESEKYEVENETKWWVSKLKKEVEKQDNIEKRKESEKHEVENETKWWVSKLKKEVEEKKDKMEKKEESKKKYIKLKKKYEEVLKKIWITLTKEDREKLIKNHDKKELKHFYNKMNDATNKNKTSKFLKKWKNKWFDELLAKISEKDKKKEKHKKNSDKKEKKKNSNTTTNNSTESKEEPSTTTNNSTESKEEKNQEGLDKEKNTYTNSKSGLTYNLYDQAKRNNKDLAARWCMLTSAACISSAVDRSITPVDYYNKHRHSLVYNSIPKMTNNKIESKVLLPGEKTKWPKEKTQQAIEEMIKNLEKWYPVEFMVHWPRHGGNNTLTTWQHYMAAVDIRENWGNKEVFIANTHNGKWWGRYPIDKAFASLRQASIYTPAQA